jgi:hypothetical protein
LLLHAQAAQPSSEPGQWHLDGHISSKISSRVSEKESVRSDGMEQQWAGSRYGSGCHLSAPGLTQLASIDPTPIMLSACMVHGAMCGSSVEGGLSLPGSRAEGPNSQICTTGRTAIPAVFPSLARAAHVRPGIGYCRARASMLNHMQCSGHGCSL